MQLNQLIKEIESRGYSLQGDRSIIPDGEVFNAPMVLIPREPPVQAECTMIPNVLTWDQGWAGVRGYARIEGAASVETGQGMTVVILRFLPVLAGRTTESK